LTLPPIDLPWPDKALSPNARVHWARKAGISSRARNAAGWATVLALGGEKQSLPLGARVAVSVVFFPPDKRHRDMDNLVASMKASFDGIADAIGIDDRHFIPTYAMGEPVKGGLVRVSLSESHPLIVESVK